jgi:hypothetical protein
MAKKSQGPAWQGVINPTRLLTPDEIEELGEECAICKRTAHVVEARRTLSKKEQKQPLSDFELADLRFTCGLHAPLDVPKETLDAIDLEFYEQMRRPLTCPEKGWQKYYINCLRNLPHCIKRCEPIRGRLTVSLEQASGMVKRGEVLFKQRQAKEKDDADTP